MTNNKELLEYTWYKKKNSKTLIRTLKTSGEDFLKGDQYTQDIIPTLIAILKERGVV
jgi:hypothetical protein